MLWNVERARNENMLTLPICLGLETRLWRTKAHPVTDRFKPSKTPATQPKIREAEPNLQITRPKTQASSIELKRAPDFQKPDPELVDASAVSDTEMVGDLDCPALSLAEYMSIAFSS